MRAWAAAFAALALAACATIPEQPGAFAPLSSLPGWAQEDHAAAFAAWRSACSVARDAASAEACAAAQRAGRLDDAAARRFLESRFRAQPVEADGVLTAYFSPLYEARPAPDDEFSAPVRPAPSDPAASGSRAEIKARPAPDALAWMRPEDLFFLQIQGSGGLAFPDGRQARAVFAASNDRPFVAIARPMAARGLVTAGDGSASSLHGWLAAHRGPDAEQVMRLDPRYIFFRLEPDDGREPRGASGVELIPGRSLAVDPDRHAMGEVFWVDAEDPSLDGARGSYRRLAIALDTGGAIKGEARADLYLGRGAAAGEEAGRVRHHLRLWRLAPVPGR